MGRVAESHSRAEEATAAAAAVAAVEDDEDDADDAEGEELPNLPLPCPLDDAASGGSDEGKAVAAAAVVATDPLSRPRKNADRQRSSCSSVRAANRLRGLTPSGGERQILVHESRQLSPSNLRTTQWPDLHAHASRHDGVANNA